MLYKIKIAAVFAGLFLLVLSCDKDNETPVDNPANNNNNNDFKEECYFQDSYFIVGEEVFIGDMADNYILFAVDIDVFDYEITNLISSLDFANDSADNNIFYNADSEHKKIPLKLAGNFNCEDITSFIYEMRKEDIVSYAHFAFVNDSCYSEYDYIEADRCINTYRNYFNVQLNDTVGHNYLIDMTIRTNTIIDSHDADNNRFRIRTDKNSMGDALQMANYFYESELFVFCKPEIITFAVE